MKASGAVNRHRKKVAEWNRQREQKSIPRRLSLLSLEQQKEAKSIMDLMYYGDLRDPALVSISDKEQVMVELVEEVNSTHLRKKRS